MNLVRLNLFRDTTASEVADALAEFYRERSRPLADQGEEWDRLDVHQEDNGWVAVTLGLAWDWKESRKAQLHVSRSLGKTGFLVFIDVSGDWGYEFFDRGRTLDHFVRRKGSVPVGFPPNKCAGQPDRIAVHLPFVGGAELAALVVQEEKAGQGGARRPDGDGAVGFLKALGVGLEAAGPVPNSPVVRSLYRKS